MSNRTVVEKLAMKEGLSIGCYNQEIETLPLQAMQILRDQFSVDAGDILVEHNGETYVIEVHRVDNELDFDLISATDYELQYGRAVGE